MPPAEQAARQLICAALRPDENETRAMGSPEEAGQPVGLVACRHHTPDVFDRRCKSFFAADANHPRRAHDLAGGTRHLVRHRGREQQRLSGRRQRRDDAADAWPEAHVEHSIGFVEHKHFQTVEVRGVAAHMVEQSSRRRNHDICGAAEAPLLRAGLDSTIHGHA